MGRSNVSTEQSRTRSRLVNGGTDRSSTPGDKPVDGVDKGVTSSTGPTPDQVSETAQVTPTSDQGHGSDLARDALRAVQAVVRQRGHKPVGDTTPVIGQRRRRRWSGSRPDDRDPQLLGRLVSRLAGELGWGEHLAGGNVFDRW